MSGTEAAASLFGSADSASDPFAALGADSGHEAPDDLFGGTNATPPVKSDAADIFDSLSQQSASSTGFPETTHSPPIEQVETHPPDSYAPVYSSPSAARGTYGSHQQWDGQQSYHNTGATSDFPTTENEFAVSTLNLGQNSYDVNKYAPTPAHDPYAPPQATSYIPSANYNSSAPQTGTYTYTGSQISHDNQNVADPYARPQTANHPTYTSQFNSYTSTISGPSATSAYKSPYANPQAPSYTSPPPPFKTDLATVPQPPAPTTNQVNRPKVSNAYDPPFPVASYSRRNVSGPAKYSQGQTTPVHSAYTAYQPATPPPLPPPPPRAPATVAPPLRPSSKTPDHVPAYAPLPAQPPPPLPSQYQPASQPQAVHSIPDPHTHATTAPAPPVTGMSSLTETRSTWSETQVSHETSTVDPAVGNDVYQDVLSPEADSGANFFDEVGQHSDDTGKQLEPPILTDTVTSPAAGSSVLGLEQAQPSNGDASSSPEASLKALSPPLRTSLDSARTSSPRQSSRPPSTSSPVYGLSHPPRVSPDLRRESLVRSEQLPRARTTSPGPPPKPYAPPQRGPTLRSNSASVAATGSVGSPGSSPKATHDRYAPVGPKVANIYGVERTGSPSSFSSHSSDGQINVKPPLPSYLPPVTESPYTPAVLAHEPTSVIENPYAPSQQSHTLKPSPSMGGYGQSPYTFGADAAPAQETTIKPTIAPYAPSPSLLGANDPLGRTSVRVPVVSFGFGGKLVTCFHDSASLNTGFDVALSSRTSTRVQIQSWKQLVPESALDLTGAFPGPLHADPGAPSAGIMKATATTQAKTKKTQLLKYLTDRVDEITQGLGYLHSGSVEKRMAEGKLVLVKLLKIMVENDGKLTGTPQIETAVRTALVPKLEGLVSGSDTGANFTTTADDASLLADTSYGSLATTSDAAPISVTTLRPAALDKIESFLLRGERRKAYHYALDEKLWAHAMVIASSIDKEAWKEVVSEFIRADLGAKGDSAFTFPGRSDSQSPLTNGREGLRVAYSLFSGQAAGAVQELVPRNVLGKTNGRLGVVAQAIPASTLGQPTPMTPKFNLPAPGTKVPAESLSKWAETVAMMMASPLTPDASAALTALGDQLTANGWLEAAHVCYLLSPQTSPVGGLGNPAARIVLLGSKSPANLPTFSKDPDSITFTEIMEYAFAAAPVAKGQEPNHGFPHLQAYRLVRAYAAAETGDVGVASRYCEAITASLVHGSVYFTPPLLEQLKGLADRLSGVSHSDKTNSWMSGKISKPSLDTIGGWLEGRFTKLVTGDPDSPASPQEDVSKQDTHSFTGPFAHYNTISSTTSSARSSPAPSFVTPAYALPPRTESPMSNKAPYGYGIDRSASAMESIRRKKSPSLSAPQPPPQAMSAGPAVTSFPSIQTQMGNYNGTSNYSNGYSPGSDLQTPRPSGHDDSTGDDSHAQEVSWWSSSGSYGGGDDTGKTPTVAHFEKVEDTHGAGNNGFFSPMMNQDFVVTSQSASPASGHRQQSTYEGDDDDLGLGNNTKRKKREAASEGDSPQGAQAAPAATTPAPAQEEKKSDAPAQSGGWFSRWWGRKENTSGGPVKASLGEESSFYYDQELKRWVNKKAGAEAPKATPPPPPPRAQTASPAMMGGGPKPPSRPPSGPPMGGTPPPPPSANGVNGHALGRPASAIDLTTSPPTSKPIGRARSNLAPPGLDSAPPTPTGTRLAPGGPPSRPKSQASQKKNVRSRYVDVFAQEGGA